MPCAKLFFKKNTFKSVFPVRNICLHKQNPVKWKTAGNISRKGTNEKDYRWKTLEVRTRNLIIKYMTRGGIL